MKKIKTGIIGTGNIGTDLLYKILRSEKLECALFMGRREESPGVEAAKKLGVRTSTDSVDALLSEPDICEILFDCTSAQTHIENARKIRGLNKFMIDLTPAKTGKMCVPCVNLEQILADETREINMITCGGQATIPIIYGISRVLDIDYAEVVSNIASKSAGAGTRANIDEFTQTTKDAIIEIAGVKKAKAIITLNPGEPPVQMHNTIFIEAQNPNMDAVTVALEKAVNALKTYVPGFEIVVGPIFERGHITITLTVVGAGDYLPSYAGNLDIITSAAVAAAEKIADTRCGEAAL